MYSDKLPNHLFLACQKWLLCWSQEESLQVSYLSSLLIDFKKVWAILSRLISSSTSHYCDPMLAICTDYTNLEIIQIDTGFFKVCPFCRSYTFFTTFSLWLLHYNSTFLLLLWIISIGGGEGTPCSRPLCKCADFGAVEPRNLGDFRSNFNGGEILRASLLLSPRLIFSSK